MTTTYVTIVFKDEFNMLDLQARSINLYFEKKDPIKFIVVLNDSDSEYNLSMLRLILAKYEIYKNATILTRKDLGCSNEFIHGWWQQQAYKLLVSRHVKTRKYIILDSKNHAVSKVSSENINCEKFSWVLGSRNDHLHDLFHKTYRYFELSSDVYLEKAPLNLTPFEINTKFAIDMIDRIEKIEGLNFYDFFIKSKLLEFDLYAAYVLASYPNYYSTKKRDFVTLFKNKVEDSEDFNKSMELLNSNEIKFFSIHKHSYSKLNEHQIDKIINFWMDRKLFETPEQANNFILTNVPNTP